MAYARAALAVLASLVTLLVSAQEGRFLNPVPVLADRPERPERSFSFVADFDRDGTNDLLLATEKLIRVLPGNYGGSFSPAMTTTTSGTFDISGVADFNHDGLPDLFGRGTRHDVAVMLGVGKGRFAAPSGFRSGYAYGEAVLAGHFDDDRFLDLALVAATALRIYSGDGRGGFTLSTLGPGSFAPLVTATAGDFDGDGWLDVAAITTRGTYVMFNQRGRAYALVHLAVAGEVATSGDFDGDGVVDLAMSTHVENVGPGSPLIIFGDRDAARFGQARATVDVLHATAMHAGDFDRNGTMDLAIIRRDPLVGIVTVGRSRKPVVKLHLGGLMPDSSAVGDLDSDGLLDLATTSRIHRA